MGSFMGHILPGMLFLIAGFWFAFKYPYRYFTKRQKRKKIGLCSRMCTLDHIEGCAKIILPSIGILAEQFANNGPKFHLTDQSNEYRDGNVWSHCTMYLFFLFAGIADCLILRFPRQIPRGIHYLAMGLANFIEGYLFYFHTHGREELDVRIHVLLLLAIWGGASALVMLCFLQAILPEADVEKRRNLNEERTEYVQLLSTDVDVETTILDGSNVRDNDESDAQHNYKKDSDNALPPGLQGLAENLQKNIGRPNFFFDGSQLKVILQMVFTITILLQGTWFSQIATILYPPGKPSWNRSSHENIQFATIFFAWHLAFIIVIVSIIYFLVGFITSRQTQKT